jgi:hypothetical protein
VSKVFAFVMTAAGFAFGQADQVDRCLDMGGSFNYQIGECDFERSQPGPQSPCLHNILGAWQIANHRAPGVSALSPEESAEWVGKGATYELDEATFDGEHCSQPSYSSVVLTSEQFTGRFHVTPTAVGLADSEVCVTEIGCPEEWVAPGSVLIHSGTTMVTMWDGVFFELERR